MMTVGSAVCSWRIALLCRQKHLTNAGLSLVGYHRQVSLSTNQKSSASTTGPSATELPKGRVFDCKPVRLELEAGKMYGWCTCGYSVKQPLCDGAHKKLNEEAQSDQSKPQFRSHKFQVDESKEYVLCNCKQTNRQPFCDGTHKQQWIQDAVK